MAMHNFTDLITAYAWTSHDGRRSAIGKSIWQWYGKTKSVLVIDLCGFSKSSTDKASILDFLAVIRRMQAAARPLVWLYEGDIVKMEADNSFAVFDTPDQAVMAALDLVSASETIREDEGLDLRLCCGIEHGEILYLEEEDFFGMPVNAASRLGEDVANADEVLVGPGAVAALAGHGEDWTVTPHPAGTVALESEVVCVKRESTKA